MPQARNWPLYAVVTAWIALSYGRGGRRGTVAVENFMKAALGLMLAGFVACLFVVGVDWGAALRGLLVPWLPEGRVGIDLLIASSAAAVGVMDWVFFYYAGLAKGWGPRHEGLARVDIFAGLALPFLLVYFVIVAVFAATLHQAGAICRRLLLSFHRRWCPCSASGWRCWRFSWACWPCPSRPRSA